MDTQTSHQPTKRVEDDYLLRGTGRYMADAPLPGQTYACFVRSQHACADIKSIDTKAALAIKGVIAVITAADIKATNVGNLSQHPPVAGRGGTKLIMPIRPALAGDRVRHTGEAVAMVIGETLAAAQDGAEAVEVDYAPADAVFDLRDAVKPGAPQVWPEAPGNIAVDWAGLAATYISLPLFLIIWWGYRLKNGSRFVGYEEMNVGIPRRAIPATPHRT